MAHHFTVPFAFEFESERLKWSIVRFEIAGREGDFKPPTLKFPGTDLPIPTVAAPVLNRSNEVLVRCEQSESTGHAFLPRGRMYKAFNPEESAYLEALGELKLAGKDVPEDMSELIVSDPNTVLPSRKKADAWAMREEFLRLEKTNRALVEFLNRWGDWGGPSVLVTARVSGQDLLRLLSPDKEPRFLLPFTIWRQREAYRAGMLGAPSLWLSHTASLSLTHRRPQFPYMGITDRKCSRAIETTITLDHLRQVKNRICARVDCNNIFSVDSEHAKIYCEQYCGHLVSVRRKRAAAKKAAKAAGRKVK